jgi:hypothetical protein
MTKDNQTSPGQSFVADAEAAARKALRAQDTRVLFDGRTVLIECLFHTIVDPNVLASRLRQAAAGPKLRLTVGTVQRRSRDLALLTKSFINTDESLEEVSARVVAISPKPDRVTVGLVDTQESVSIWTELHRVQDGGD